MIATGFKRSWQYDQCIGTLDGKHIVLQPPENSGSMFFNDFAPRLVFRVEANFI